MANMSQIKLQGQKLAHLRKEYLNCDWTSDANIYMTDVHWGRSLVPLKDFSKLSFLAKLLLAKNCPILGIQLPNAVDDTQSV